MEDVVARDLDDASAAATANGSGYDSVAGCGGMYSNLEELNVFNPRAILSCFVVIYKTSILS